MGLVVAQQSHQRDLPTALRTRTYEVAELEQLFDYETYQYGSRADLSRAAARTLDPEHLGLGMARVPDSSLYHDLLDNLITIRG